MVDLESGRVLWGGKGRGKEALVGFWERLRQSRTKIEAVACDMSGVYWSAINEHLPDAALIFDPLQSLRPHPSGSLRLAASLWSAPYHQAADEKIDEMRRG